MQQKVNGAKWDLGESIVMQSIIYLLFGSDCYCYYYLFGSRMTSIMICQLYDPMKAQNWSPSN